MENGGQNCDMEYGIVFKKMNYTMMDIVTWIGVIYKIPTILILSNYCAKVETWHRKGCPFKQSEWRGLLITSIVDCFKHFT